VIWKLTGDLGLTLLPVADHLFIVDKGHCVEQGARAALSEQVRKAYLGV